MAGIGIDHSKLPGVKEGRGHPGVGGRGAGVCRGEEPSPGWGELDGTWRLGGNLGEGKGETLLFQNKYYYLIFFLAAGAVLGAPRGAGG